MALTISNDGHHADRLLRATSPAAATVTLTPRARAERGVPIPSLGSVHLQRGRSVTLRGLRRTAVDGVTVPITFVFARTGPVTVYAAVEDSPGIA